MIGLRIHGERGIYQVIDPRGSRNRVIWQGTGNGDCSLCAAIIAVLDFHETTHNAHKGQYLIKSYAAQLRQQMEARVFPERVKKALEAIEV